MIIATKHGFMFSIESHGFMHAEECKHLGESFIESELDRLSAATVAAIFGESVAQAYGHTVETPKLARLLTRAHRVATKGWQRTDNAFFMISGWIETDAA